MSYFLGLQKTIAFVHFGVSTHQTCKLFLDLLKMLFVGHRVRFVLRLLVELFIYYAGCEVLGIQDPYLFFVYKDHEETFIQEEALVDGKAFAYVEAVKLDVGDRASVFEIGPNCQLDDPAPCDSEHRICLISIDGRQAFAPIQIRNNRRIDVIRPLDYEDVL